ncbi:MAG: lamin tail domain-containing protein [bacterium]
MPKFKTNIINFSLILAGAGLLGLVLTGPVQAQDAYYPNGTLIKGSAPQVYLLVDGVKQWITNEEVFNDLQLAWDKIMVVSDQVLEQYPTGREIKSGNSYPDGVLVKGSSPKVYYLENNKKRWIPDEDTFLALNLWWSNIFIIDDKKLGKIKEGNDMPIIRYTPYRPNTVISLTPDAETEETEIRFEFNSPDSGWGGNDITFETFLTNEDTEWKDNKEKQYRTFNLEKINRRYTFFIRAKNKSGYADQTPARYTFEIKISPYYGQVTINASSLKNSDYLKEKVELYNRANYPVNITNWTLTSARSSDLYKMPTAYIVPAYEALDYTGNLELQPKDKVLIYTSPSPLGYSSDTRSQYGFHLNKCTGYLNERYDFTDSLPNQCPKLALAAGQTYNLGGACEDFVKKIKTCHQPATEELSQVTSSCADWVEDNANYESCIANHRYDNDFFVEKWYLFMGRTKEAWNNSDDAMILRDEQGLIVDRYEY